MTNYQFLIFNELKTKALAPEPVFEFLKQTESFSTSGNPSKGEGGDFILESINAKTKRWLPPGAPSEKHWKEVCRNIEKLEQIRDKIQEEIGFKRKGPHLYQRDLSLETFQWRVFLRKCGYFEKMTNHHVSVSGKVLDPGLLGFETSITENFKKYLLSAGNQVKLTPVFCTELERKKFYDVKNKTKAEISLLIQNAITEIDNLGNSDEALVLQRQWEKTKVGTKEALLQFYGEVIVALQEASVGDETDSDESGCSSDED